MTESVMINVLCIIGICVAVVFYIKQRKAHKKYRESVAKLMEASESLIKTINKNV